MPEAGGYFDQDYRLMKTMETLSSVYENVVIFESYMSSPQGVMAYPDNHPSRRVIRALKDAGVYLNGS